MADPARPTTESPILGRVRVGACGVGMGVVSMSLCGAARTAMLSGDHHRAQELLRQALSAAETDEDRSTALALLARLALTDGEAAGLLPTLEDAVAEAAADNPETAGTLLLDVVVLKLYAGGDDALADAERARELTASADELTRARADTVLGLAHMFAGNPEAARHLLSRSADLIRLGGTPDEVVYLLQHVIVGLAGVERYDDSAALSRRYVRSVRAVGADGLLPVVLCYLANSVYFTSCFAEQEMAAAEAVGMARLLRQPGFEVYGEVCRALAAGLRGDAAAAVASLEECLPRLADAGMGVMSGITLMGWDSWSSPRAGGRRPPTGTTTCVRSSPRCRRCPACCTGAPTRSRRCGTGCCQPPTQPLHLDAAVSAEGRVDPHRGRACRARTGSSGWVPTRSRARRTRT